MQDRGCQDVIKARHFDGIWYRRLGKWLNYMEGTHWELVHEVDLSYLMLGFRQALILTGFHRCKEEHSEAACSPPEAKCRCVNRKVTGRIKSSPDSHMRMPKKTRRAP